MELFQQLLIYFSYVGLWFRRRSKNHADIWQDHDQSSRSSKQQGYLFESSQHTNRLNKTIDASTSSTELQWHIWWRYFYTVHQVQPGWRTVSRWALPIPRHICDSQPCTVYAMTHKWHHRERFYGIQPKRQRLFMSDAYILISAGVRCGGRKKSTAVWDHHARACRGLKPLVRLSSWVWW